MSAIVLERLAARLGWVALELTARECGTLLPNGPLILSHPKYLCSATQHDPDVVCLGCTIEHCIGLELLGMLVIGMLI